MRSLHGLSLGKLMISLLLVSALLAACVQTGEIAEAPGENQVATAGPGILTPVETSPVQASPSPAPAETAAPTAIAQAETLSGAAPATPEEPTPTGVPAGGQVIEPDNALQVQATSGIRLPETRLFAWLPDSGGVVVATERDIIEYSLNPLKETGRFSAPAVTHLELSPTGDILVWAGEDKGVHLWDIASKTERHTLTGRSMGITDLEFSPDGTLLALSTPEGSIELWDVASGQLQQTWGLADWVAELAFSPDGSLLAGVELDAFTVHLYRLPSGQEERSLSWTEHASPALYGVQFTPDWQSLVWVTRGTIQLMDVAQGSLGPNLGHEDFVSASDISPASGLLASAAAATIDGDFVPAVYLWDIATGERIKLIPQDVAVTALDFSPDGRTLAILTFDNVLRFWEIPQ